MKKAGFILLSLCTLSFCLLLGIFIGRNLTDHYQYLPVNSTAEDTSLTETATDYLLNINTASKIQLTALPGIGDIIADRILDYRRNIGDFQSVDDLLKVEGIGEGKLSKIEKMITVGG